MRVAWLRTGLLIVVAGLFVGGCVASGQYDDLKLRNRAQQERLDQLESELAAANLQMAQLQRQLAAANERANASTGSLREEIAALEQDIREKKKLIQAMQQRLVGGIALPPELSTQLEDFAAAHPELVSYEPERGMVKFKSDLLFDKGSDKVAASAEQTIKSLCGILTSDQAGEFDIIVAGHTDDIPIAKPETRQKHPTNWHLSVHRAISVEQILQDCGLKPERLSVRGFGEFRPAAPNQPGKKGNPVNRRVEIYIVPPGT